MRRVPGINKRSLVILHDLGMAMLAWFCSWWIRFNLVLPFPEIGLCLSALPLVVLVQAVAFWRFSLYRGLWRFASLPDLWNIFRAAVIGGMAIMLVLFVLVRLEGVPRSIVILYPLLLMILLEHRDWVTGCGRIIG